MTAEVLLEFFKFLIFPGALFAIIMALFFIWADRKLYARMQNRVGPPLKQPIYDIIKLFTKQEIRPEGADEPEFTWLPPLDLYLSLMTAFLIPMSAGLALISFEGDLIFFLFLVTLNGTVAFLVGWATNSPYTLIGGARAAVMEIAIELPFALAMIGPALIVGSLRINTIEDELGAAVLEKPLLILPLAVLFLLGIVGMVGILERVPFDAPHAETEIIAGWETELSGRGLGMIILAQEVFHFTLSAVLAALFLGGTNSPLNQLDMLPDWLLSLLGIVVLLLKALFVLLLISTTRTVLSRVRIDQLANTLWMHMFPLSLLCIGAILLIIEM